MNPIRLLSALASILIGGLALAPAAFADENEGRQVRRFLDSAALALPEEDADSPLPTSLSLKQDEDELRSDYRRADYRRAKPVEKDPIVDFSKFEMGGYLGIVAYSGDFEADPNYVVGITARLPVSGLPGEWGVWGSLHLSYIRRDLPFFYRNTHGTWIGFSVGGDFTLLKNDIWYLRPQLGVMYAHWYDIQALDSGMGVLAGLQFGFFWIKGYKKAVVTLTPQLSFDGDNWIGFASVGFSVDF